MPTLAQFKVIGATMAQKKFISETDYTKYGENSDKIEKADLAYFEKLKVAALRKDGEVWPNSKILWNIEF